MAPEPQGHLVYCDAHNHVQDERLEAFQEEMWDAIKQEGIHRMVVNGSSEADWPAVLALAQQHSEVIPSFGVHPWYVKERSAEWQQELLRFLNQVPAAVGEIGLDRWIKGHDMEQQQEMFCRQMEIAARRNLPASIHCLQAWGKLLDLLRAGPCPACGFLLHSFGGPAELIEPLAELGAYFSLPGYFAHERKGRQREVFKQVPAGRLLIETDAPDQPLPAERVSYPLADDATGRALNHPANLKAVYRFAAELRGEPLEVLAESVASNFRRLFGGVDH